MRTRLPAGFHKDSSDFTVWIVLYAAVDVEYHCGATIEIVSRPLRERIRIRIAGPRESNPR